MHQRSIVTAATVSIAALLAASLTAACNKSGGGDNAAPTATDTAPAMGMAPAEAAAPAMASAMAAAQDAAPEASGAMAAERRHVGLAGVLLRAAYDLTLTDAQKALLDKAEDQLYPDGALSPWAAAKAFQGDLVAGIRAGKIDPAVMKADEAVFDKAVAAGQAAEASALDTLHGALDAPTRQSLVDRVKARRGGHDPMASPSGGADAGAALWAARRLERLTKQLGLDEAQQKQVAALLAKDTGMSASSLQSRRDAMQKRVDALLATFPKDTFDAKKADLAVPPGKTPHDRLEAAATFATALVPLLRPDQVSKFAEQTERMGSRPERYFEDIEHGPPSPGGGDEPGGR